MVSTRPYGIVANVINPDRCLRMGAKVWIIDGTGGQGWDTFVVRGLSRGGREIEKWTTTKRFGNFRAAWIPPMAKGEPRYMRFESRHEAEQVAAKLNEFADNFRAPASGRQLKQ